VRSAGVYPITKLFSAPDKEAMYTTLLVSSGLTFGTISALFGLSHGIINQAQYSSLVATVTASAVIPSVIASRADRIVQLAACPVLVVK
jgi:glutathione-regulated potassium-efflux system ancillary protein KefC